jgi:hypothetical protein
LDELRFLPFIGRAGNVLHYGDERIGKRMQAFLFSRHTLPQHAEAKLGAGAAHCVMISDMERTIIDGLRHPAFAGGVTEVAKGLWMKRDVLQVERLVDYARRLGVGAVVRRLGYLLEHYDLADTSVLEPLRGMLTATYQRLDPLLPAEGAFLSRWRLQLNVTPEEPQIHGIPLTASAGRDISLRAVLRALCRSASTHRP